MCQASGQGTCRNDLNGDHLQHHASRIFSVFILRRKMLVFSSGGVGL